MPELKVMVKVDGKGAMVGVQDEGTDPVCETILGATLEQALEAVPPLLAVAREKWAKSPRNPAYAAPPPPPAAPRPAPGPVARPVKAKAATAKAEPAAPVVETQKSLF